MHTEMLTIVFITKKYFLSLIEFNMTKIEAFTMFGLSAGFIVDNRKAVIVV